MTTQAAITTAEITRSLKLTMGERTRLRSELSDKIKRTKLTPEQFIVLSEIPEQGIGASDLAAASGILGPSLSRMLNTMRASGVISSEWSDKDGRALVIKLGRKGKNLLARVQ